MKKKNSGTKYLVVAGLVLVGVVMILGTTYGLWVIDNTQENDNVLGSQCLELEYTAGSSINLAYNYPVVDSEGLTGVPYNLNILNNCDSNTGYDIVLEQMPGNTLSPEYLKVGVNDVTIGTLASLTTATPTISGATAAYVITTDNLPASTNTKDYAIRVWLDENMPMIQTDQTLEFKISVTGYPIK